MTALPRKLTAALLLAVLGLCIYRARTQNLVIDEAWVFERFVNQPLSEMAKSWDACNHVLHSVLMMWFRDTFGIAEVVLRIPTLLGSALYLSATYCLTRLLFSGWRQPLAAALLVLHPMVIDLLVAARGYGLALGLFAWALHSVISYTVRGRERKWLTRAGIFAGLSVAANLTVAVPVAALGLALLLMETRAPRIPWRVIDSYFGPAVVISTLIVMIPLLQSQRSDFYFGEVSPLDTLRRMYDVTLKTEHAWFSRWGWMISPYSGFALTGVFLWITGVTAISFRRQQHWHFRNAPAVVVGGTLSLTGILLCVLGAFGVPFPSGRTGLYLITLFTLSILLLLRDNRVVLAAGIAIVLIYASENDTRYFVEWRYDAGTRELLRRFDEDRHQRRLPEPVSLAVASSLSLTTKYYQLRRNMSWMKMEPFESTGSSYVLFDSRSAMQAESSQLEIVAKHVLSGAVLARRLP